MADLSSQIYRTARGPIEAAVVDPPSGRSKVALLAIHGTPGDFRQLRGFAEDFSERVTVVLPTRPAYGRTPTSTGPRPVDQAAAYAALLDELGIEQVVVIGVSGGGPSSRAFAAHQTDRCRGLVLCCAVVPDLVVLPAIYKVLMKVPGLWPALSRLEVRKARKELENPAKLEADVIKTLKPAELAVLESSTRLRADLMQFSHDRVEALSGVGLRNDFRALVVDLKVLNLGDVDTSVVPTLIIHGDADDVVPLNHGEHNHSTIPGSELIVLEGFGHALPATARDDVNAVIARALETAGV